MAHAHKLSWYSKPYKFLFEGAIICTNYSTYWAIIRGKLIFGGWANNRGFTVVAI